MKPVSVIFSAVFLSILASFITVKLTAQNNIIPVVKSDSAYDRVIAKNELVCGVIPWAPYKVYDPNTKEWSGFAIEYYRKAFATLDINVTFKEVVLGNQIQDLNAGRVDAICDDGPWTLSAGKFVDFSDAVYASVMYPYIRVDETNIKTRSDLGKKETRFTAIDGDLSADLAKRLFPDAQILSMPGTTDAAQLFTNVATGKADVTISDPSVFGVFDKNNPGKMKPLFKDQPLGIYKAVMSVKKGDFKMLSLANEAIDNALVFGITDEVINKADPEHKNLMRVENPYKF